MIRLENVSKTFTDSNKEVHAVNNVSLTINDGDIFGIIGFSGAGKSTLVRCINLLEKPTEGKVFVDDAEITALSGKELRKARKKIGMIFQHFNLMPSRTIFGNVAYPLRGSGLSKEEIKEKVHHLLELVGISEKENAFPSQLSGGQKQRVAIARALANDPNILLCDEATSALDPQTTKSILKLLQQLNQTLGITVVVITHEMAVVKEICNRVAVMDHGDVVEEGEVFHVFASPKEPLTRSFIKTTSNLQKIEELIEADSPVVATKKGELIVRLTYVEKNTSEPLISTVTQKFGIILNIVFADVEIVQNAPIGGTVAIVSGEGSRIDEALQYLRDKNVGVEVIKDDRVLQ
ncbi:MAG TPA: methionine ABC transporter ATP-binding protein [Lachnospiraceae bacterium]|jgi:D-methionine ABC transporter, ATP-binding protein|nr:methionine ABC transporter ATP-binding protein [Lachnospiraceae bacterium]